MVLTARKLRGQGADTVVADEVTGAMQAVEHLIMSGRRRVACVSGPLVVTPYSQRLSGYRMGVDRARIVGW